MLRSRNAFAVGLLALAILPAFGARDARAADLALSRVLLSTGGVGYFEWSAEVDGPADLTLEVRRDQVDDVLKSLIVFDDKGGIGGVSLPGRDPVPELFRDKPFGAEALTSPSALLSALKGAQVTVAAPRALAGKVLSVEPETTISADGRLAQTRHRVSLVTPTGVEQFLLEDATGLRLADPALQAQVDAALDGLASNRAQDRRKLTISTRGSGKRNVRVAYVAAAPLWKATYRLSLDASGKARLQGWAVVENLTGADWKNVGLTLVSGSPVTFRQALYAAYFLARPEIPVEVVGRVLPGIDKGGIADMRGELKKSKAAEMLMAPAQEMAARNQDAAMVGGAAEMPAASPPMMASGTGANAADSQTQVAFRIGKPVDVVSGNSLTLPILDREIEADRVSLYQQGTDPRHPMAALALTNDGETSLPPGVVTFYERGANGEIGYSGDARLPPVPAGAKRMLSFALDTRTLVDVATDSTQRIADGSISNGVFSWRTILRTTTTYTVAAAPKEGRSLIIEHPRMDGWDLVKPSGEIEKTDDAWRIPLSVSAGATKAIEVVTEHPEYQSISIGDAGADQILAWASASDLDASVRERFRKLATLQQDAAEKGRAVEALEATRKTLLEEQNRLRANLGAVPAQSDIQARYLKSLDAQETQIQALMHDLDAARIAKATADDAVRAALAG